MPAAEWLGRLGMPAAESAAEWLGRLGMPAAVGHGVPAHQQPAEPASAHPGKGTLLEETSEEDKQQPTHHLLNLAGLAGNLAGLAGNLAGLAGNLAALSYNGLGHPLAVLEAHL